ncbi:hypothetical protein P691DRAFT_790634 [Macrolepiota fuliginosa MF-IS2]|uniref:Uncharacterized protein n=1 Tax=Macrolepiota fuliginosa MF-IS2 TaxID=1400762 RepID=A0A9P5XE28_9AGAR|nr:hypothetical protein P691DRAFT_790634 [Macrolepiota fuliginosa MF-IS2]
MCRSEWRFVAAFFRVDTGLSATGVFRCTCATVKPIETALRLQSVAMRSAAPLVNGHKLLSVWVSCGYLLVFVETLEEFERLARNLSWIVKLVHFSYPELHHSFQLLASYSQARE